MAAGVAEGIFIVLPIFKILLLFIPLARMISPTVVWYCLAKRDNDSPLFTVCKISSCASAANEMNNTNKKVKTKFLFHTIKQFLNR